MQSRTRIQKLAQHYSEQKKLNPQDEAWLREHAELYALRESAARKINDTFFEDLLLRVDIVPASLALAQGAIESGWGTSRFADEGNSLFGQWSWSGGIKPLEQRAAAHGDHRIAAFESTGLSVWSNFLPARAWLENHLVLRKPLFQGTSENQAIFQRFPDSAWELFAHFLDKTTIASTSAVGFASFKAAP